MRMANTLPQPSRRVSHESALNGVTSEAQNENDDTKNQLRRAERSKNYASNECQSQNAGASPPFIFKIQRKDLSMRTDVVMGRKGFNSTIFTETIEEWSLPYKKAKPNARQAVATECLNAMIRQGCRFLTVDNSSSNDDVSTTTTKSDASAVYVFESDMQKVLEKIVRCLRKDFAQRYDDGDLSSKDSHQDQHRAMERPHESLNTSNRKQSGNFTEDSSIESNSKHVLLSPACQMSKPSRLYSPVAPTTLNRWHSLYCPTTDNEALPPADDDYMQPSLFFEDPNSPVRKQTPKVIQTGLNSRQGSKTFIRPSHLQQRYVPQGKNSVSPETTGAVLGEASHLEQESKQGEVADHIRNGNLAGFSGIDGKVRTLQLTTNENSMNDLHDYIHATQDQSEHDPAGFDHVAFLQDAAITALHAAESTTEANNEKSNHCYTYTTKSSSEANKKLPLEEAIPPLSTPACGKYKGRPLVPLAARPAVSCHVNQSTSNFQNTVSIQNSVPPIYAEALPQVITTTVPEHSTGIQASQSMSSLSQKKATYRHWLQECVAGGGEVPATRHRFSLDELAARFDEVERRAEELSQHNRHLMDRLAHLESKVRSQKDSGSVEDSKPLVAQNKKRRSLRSKTSTADTEHTKARPSKQRKASTARDAVAEEAHLGAETDGLEENENIQRSKNTATDPIDPSPQQDDDSKRIPVWEV